MKSNKQPRAEIQQLRASRKAKALLPTSESAREGLPSATAPCSPESLAPYNSYGTPPFVARGHYIDLAFTCAKCPKEEVWRATQQKWWYEVAKGSVESRAKLCNSCRRAERERKAAARRVHLEGLEKQHAVQKRQV